MRALLLSGVVTFGFVDAGNALTITETVNFPGPGNTPGSADFMNATGTTMGPNPIQLNYFDLNSGTLNSIAFSYSYTFSSSINLVCNGPCSGNVRTESGAQFGSNNSGVTGTLNRVVNTDTAGLSFGTSVLTPVAADVLGSDSSYSITASNGGISNLTSQGNASNSFVDTTATDLTAFSRVGGGSFTPLFNSLTGLLIISSGGNARISQTTLATASLTVAYNFFPAATTPVPEPASLALLGFGLAGLAAIRRR